MKFSNLQNLILNYLSIFPEKFSAGHINLIKNKKLELYFSWYGDKKPDVGHYYKIDSKRFVIQLANTQSDVSGDSANHLHALWIDR